MPYNLIIDTLTLGQIRARIDRCSPKVQVMKYGNDEVLNLIYEPEVFDDTDDELTTDTESETDVGEVSDKDEFSGLVMTLDVKNETKNEPEEIVLVEQNVEQLEE